MKIYFAGTCGTYPTWLKWTVASIYNIVDKVIIANGGYDPYNPEAGDDLPLKRELQQLKEIDIDTKIIQLKPRWNYVDGIIKKGRDETGRSRNMTHAMRACYEDGADWILKLDSDQIAHTDMTREELELLVNNGHTGYTFAQYAEFHREWNEIMALPGKWTDDGALFFKAHLTAHAGTQGSPGIGEEFPIYDIHTFNMRSICPEDVDEYEYHFKRFWYHTWGPNEIGEHEVNRKEKRKLTFNEIFEIADQRARSMLESVGRSKEAFNNDERFPPYKPLVVEMGSLEYIKAGYPK
jgi:hypothetical protein